MTITFANTMRLIDHGEALLDFHANTRPLRGSELDFLLKRHGVPVRALYQDGDGFLSTIGCAFASACGRCFDFAEEENGATKAMIFVARDMTGTPVDLVAWWPAAEKVASAAGRVALLGAHDIMGPRLEEPLAVYRSPLGWLKAGRSGVVAIHKAGAWRALEGVTVLGEDIDHGLELRKLLAAPTPSIVVRQPIAEAA